MRQDQIEALRREVVSLGRRGRGRPYPAELRRRLDSAIGELRLLGRSWTAIAESLGISKESAKRWCEASRQRAYESIRPVVVEDEYFAAEDKDVVLVSPDGWRVSGLGVADVIDVLKAVR